jgi:hypothetical protein
MSPSSWPLTGAYLYPPDVRAAAQALVERLEEDPSLEEELCPPCLGLGVIADPRAAEHPPTCLACHGTGERADAPL